jgi:hypothetical protein
MPTFYAILILLSSAGLCFAAAHFADRDDKRRARQQKARAKKYDELRASDLPADARVIRALRNGDVPR